MNYVNAVHMSPSIRKEMRTRTVEKAIKELTPFTQNFDAIAVRGMSGALLVCKIADALNKEIILIRKPDSSHSPFLYEGPNVDNIRYIILDDLICSGYTVQEVRKRIDYQNNTYKIVGLYLYSQGAWPGAEWDGIPMLQGQKD